MSKLDETSFAHAVAQLALTQADMAVAFLWYRDLASPGTEASVAELGNLLHSHALTGKVNHARLRDQLAKHRATVRGKNPANFRLKLATVPELTEKFGPLTGRKPPAVEHSLLPASQTQGTRRYLERVALQLNGCYEGCFYDAAAVMMRRLVETLLIEAFEQQKQGAAVKVNGEYMQFGDMIGVAGSGKYLKLARGTARSLDRIKAVGDTAAHKRTYNTSKTDLDDVAHELRLVVSELMNLSGIHPTA